MAKKSAATSSVTAKSNVRAVAHKSLPRDATRARAMRIEPSRESLAEIPEIDLSTVKHAVRRTKGGVESVRGRPVTLRLLRLARRKTQSEVSRAAHIAQGDVSVLENGDLDTRQIATLARYVAALGGRLEIAAVFDDGARLVIESPEPD